MLKRWINVPRCGEKKLSVIVKEAKAAITGCTDKASNRTGCVIVVHNESIATVSGVERALLFTNRAAVVAGLSECVDLFERDAIPIKIDSIPVLITGVP